MYTTSVFLTNFRKTERLSRTHIHTYNAIEPALSWFDSTTKREVFWSMYIYRTDSPTTPAAHVGSKLFRF